MRLAALLLSGLSCATLHAEQLHFTSTTIDLKPAADARESIARFAFSNPGTVPVTITEITSTCGCTTVQLAKRTYQPGEGGELVATLALNGLSGAQDKTIHVTSEAGIVTLHLRAELPAAPSITPAFVSWQQNAALEARTVRVNFPGAQPDRLIAATSSIPGFNASIAEGEHGGWMVTITPTTTAEGTNAMVVLQTKQGRTMNVFVSVVPILAPKGVASPAPSSP